MFAKKKFLVFMVLVMALSIGSLVQAEEVEIPSGKLPILVTSAGQSPDDNMIRVLATRLGLEVKHDPLITVDELGDVKTILFAIGGSAKGLGEAGIDIRDEEQRIKEILDRMDELKEEEPGEYLVVGFHIGGEGRRGDLSQRSIDAVSPRVDLLVVWEEGNQDGLFTRIAEENGIPLIILEFVRDTQNVLAEMFAEYIEE